MGHILRQSQIPCRHALRLQLSQKTVGSLVRCLGEALLLAPFRRRGEPMDRPSLPSGPQRVVGPALVSVGDQSARLSLSKINVWKEALSARSKVHRLVSAWARVASWNLGSPACCEAQKSRDRFIIVSMIVRPSSSSARCSALRWQRCFVRHAFLETPHTTEHRARSTGSEPDHRWGRYPKLCEMGSATSLIVSP